MEKKELSPFKKIEASFDNSPDGFSARKLSAFTAIVVALITTLKFADNKTLIQALIIWLVFSLLCMGIITAEQIIKFYKRDSIETNESSTTSTTTSSSSESTDPKM